MGGVARPGARPQGRDHSDGLLVTADLTELRLLHHDLAAVLAEPVHLELDDDPPLLLPHLVLSPLVLLLLRSGLTDVIVSSDQLTTLNYLLLNFLTLEKLFNYFLKASTCQTVLPCDKAHQPISPARLCSGPDVSEDWRADRRLGEPYCILSIRNPVSNIAPYYVLDTG